MIRSSLVASLLIAPVSALAQQSCPGPDDRNKPIRIVFEDQTVEVYRPQTDMVTRIEGYDGPEPVYTIDVVHGTHMLSYVSIVDGTPDPGSQIVYDYGVPLSQMPVPSPGGRWQVDASFADADGTQAEAQAQAYGPLQSVQIGACIYDAFDVFIAYDSPDAYMETLIYLPALGLAYLYTSQTADDPGVPVPAIEIAVAK